MGRIEDNEADRIERARQEAQSAAKRLDAKRTDESRQFNVLVQKTQDTKKSSDKKESEGKQKQDSANQKLLSRRGISANQTTTQLSVRSKDNNEKSRQNAMARETGRAAGRRGLEEKRDLEAGRSDNGGGSIRRATGKSGAGSQQRQDSAKDSAALSQEQQVGREAFVQAMGQAVAPMAGLGSEVRGSAGAPTMLSAKEIVDEIVARVHQGVDQHGFGLIEFDLRDNVLAGSRLTLHATPNGVAIKFQTGDKEVADLLSSSGAGKMLATAMQNAKVQLKGLEVNGKEVKYT